MHHLLKTHSPVRIFAVSGLISIAALVFVGATLGLQAALLTLALIVIEMTFSFDNAIINARILNTMSPFWQRMFMTIGILIAVFGMRIVFPIVVVMLGAGLSWQDVLNLALNNPDEYAEKLHEAHPSISSFGGMFLMMLTLDFFLDKSRDVLWLKRFESAMQKIGHTWMPTVISVVITGVVAVLPMNAHPIETLRAGLFGIGLYLAIKGLTELFSRRQGVKNESGKALVKTGMAGFIAFLYLEVLDASFSLDGVIGAFAITQNVVLIAIGLGVGALWVRSFTLYMVHHKTLHTYHYLENGAHYTIGLLSLFLLSSLFFGVPEAIAGIAGVAIIAMSIVASKRDEKDDDIVTIE
jgi:uncharacterized protein